jgi:hypothetical protein
LRGGWCKTKQNMRRIILSFLNNLNVKKRNIGKSNPHAIFSPGLILSDVDREINSDLVEIHKFFAPIDNLFGDYETRKKFGVDHKLYRRIYSKSEIIGLEKYNSNKIRKQEDIYNAIEPEVWRESFTLENGIIKGNIFNIDGTDETYDVLELETIIFTRSDFIKKDSKNLLVIYLIYEEVFKDLVIDFEFIESINLRKNFRGQFIDKINKVEINGDRIEQIFIIDPVKIFEIKDMCDTRFKNKLEKLEIPEITEGTALKNIIEIKKALFTLMKSKSDEESGIYRITDTSVYDLFPDAKKGNLQPIHKLAEKFCRRKIKMKSLEKFNFIRIRIGWENNRYVLFLHPYESETNYPVKYPPKAP